MRFDHRIFLKQRQKSRHDGAELLFVFKPVPIDRNPLWIFLCETTHQRVTEVARHARAGDSRNLRFVERRQIDVGFAQLRYAISESSQGSLDLLKSSAIRRVSAKEEQRFVKTD